ncbi:MULTISPECIES: copper-binding protein [unclassified Pseudomonas]|uniref:copper-binding protein n=1 Tax=unclassified Pseudomonas TaxID=196821 RepID=UPI002A35FF7A|nr:MULTISPECIES: copper-binding protein [unclassified Pseudomonas]MDX9669475.1 copper-binding protein [Pseudomonas sp. P8_250]WPN36487.1 copper-binding protein [Pseudomonas sp. P8_139]WPN41712.1 copper-binding protein [Pseudomonas sp. P8_229]
MKLTLVAVAGSLFLFASASHAENRSAMKMDDMPGMDMQQQTQQTPLASAEGTIKAIDPASHTVTLAHDAVAALQWPPMTMAFAVTPAQLNGLVVGDRVTFSFRMEGSRATIVSISK